MFFNWFSLISTMGFDYLAMYFFFTLEKLLFIVCRITFRSFSDRIILETLSFKFYSTCLELLKGRSRLFRFVLACYNLFCFGLLRHVPVRSNFTNQDFYRMLWLSNLSKMNFMFDFITKPCKRYCKLGHIFCITKRDN